MLRPPDLAVVLVHYHTPGLAAECIAAMRSDLQGLGLEVEWLLVDNGSKPEDQPILDGLEVRRITPSSNLGYGGGLNLGVAASRARFLFLMNPDVLVEPGCSGALLEQLSAGAGIAGPRFFWDREGRLLLPPNEPRTRSWELAASLAHRGPGWAKRARRRWRRHARRHWANTEPMPSLALSGALLATRRDAWELLGGFDESYHLYFEETDWLARAKRRGLVSRYVPQARAQHLYDRSASQESRASAWFAESRRRFYEHTYGRWFYRALTRLETRSGGPETTVTRWQAPSLELAAAQAGLWVEISPRAQGFPAAAERIPAGATSWALPEEIWARLPPGRFRVTLVSEAGDELDCQVFERGA